MTMADIIIGLVSLGFIVGCVFIAFAFIGWMFNTLN